MKTQYAIKVEEMEIGYKARGATWANGDIATHNVKGHNAYYPETVSIDDDKDTATTIFNKEFKYSSDCWEVEAPQGTLLFAREYWLEELTLNDDGEEVDCYILMNSELPSAKRTMAVYYDEFVGMVVEVNGHKYSCQFEDSYHNPLVNVLSADYHNHYWVITSECECFIDDGPASEDDIPDNIMQIMTDAMEEIFSDEPDDEPDVDFDTYVTLPHRF